VIGLYTISTVALVVGRWLMITSILVLWLQYWMDSRDTRCRSFWSTLYRTLACNLSPDWSVYAEHRKVTG
jgi:hypothetical protein